MRVGWGQPGCPRDLVDKRIECAVLAVRRAKKSLAEMRFATDALFQCCRDARLAEAGLAGDQYDLAVARLGALPAPHQQVDFLRAPDEWAQRRAPQGLESAGDDARTQYPPGWHRCGNALDFNRTEITILEQITDQPAGVRGDDDRVGLGERLQPGGEVGGFADDRLLLRRSLANQIADDHQPSGDADPCLQIDKF